MHLDEERLQRLLDSELPPAEARSAREHLAVCDDCRWMENKVQKEQQEVGEWLRVVDVPVTFPGVETIVHAARRRSPARMRWAAGLLVALGAAGVTYAIPGSPLRQWVDEVVHRRSGGAAAPSPDATPSAVAGISVPPGDHLVIEFARAQAGAAVRVSLSDGHEVVVTGPSGSASFTSEADRLVVDNQPLPVVFDVRIPRDAPRVEIRVAGRRALFKDGVHLVPAPDAAGALMLPLGSPGG